MNKTFANSLLLTAIAGFLLAVLPMAANAQTQTVDTSLAPDGLPTMSSTTLTVNKAETLEVPWTVTLTLPIQATGTVIPSTTITWSSISCPQGVSMSGPLTTVVPVNQNAQKADGNVIKGKSAFNVVATQDAAGEKSFACTFTGKVNANGALKASPDSPFSTPQFQAKFFSLITANVPLTIQGGGPQTEINYEITLTNLGNANTNLDFTVVGDVPAGWSAVPPVVQTLGPSQQSGGQGDFTKKVFFTVSTPHKNGWNNDQTNLQVKIVPSSTITPDDKGNPITVSVLARVRGVYVPGPEPFLLVAAILGTALVARRMRKAE